jgi:hypothetical protein
MVNLTTLRIGIGFGLKGMGFFWSMADRFLCRNICENKCTISQNNICSLLFLFVGIIFIICGYAVIVMKDKKRKKLKTKIKNALKLTKI